MGLIVLLLMQSAIAHACELGGRFEKIVIDTIGRERAEQSASFGMSVIAQATGRTLCEEFVGADQNIYPASTFKTLVAVAAVRKIDLGLIRLDQPIAIDQWNADTECRFSSCSTYARGRIVSVDRLLTDMITVSNNLATNQLIDLVGKDFINQTADLLGASSLRVFRKVYDEVDPEPTIKTPNRASARGFTELYREISSGRLRLLSDQARGYVNELLRRQKINGSLNKFFPPGLTFFHKTGNTSQVTGDGGFYVLPSGNIVILVGLQGFVSFQSLQQIGRAAVALTVKTRNRGH